MAKRTDQEQSDEVSVQTEESTQLESPVQLIYVGPNLEHGRLAQYTVFSDGVPGHLSDLIEAHPSIHDLIVPVGELGNVQIRISQPGTPEHTAFAQLSARKE